jgi:hypothetical protein
VLPISTVNLLAQGGTTMKDLVLRSQISLAASLTTVLTRAREETGQGTVEWLGIIVVVVALAIALKGQIADVADAVAKAITDKIGTL